METAKGEKMPITAAQKAQAEQRQWTAARDGAPQVRLVAGPGTGKSHQFLNEMSVPSVTRTTGLSQAEAATIIAEVNNL